MVKTLFFLAIMLTAIAMGAGLAHLFELPNKINISAADYLTVQRNYDNWWIVGLSVPLAFLSVLVLTISLRGTGTPFTLALIALVLLAGEMIVFWGFTAPVNRATENWTVLPSNGKSCATNGNIRTPCELFSTCRRWERSSCPFWTGAPRPPGESPRDFLRAPMAGSLAAVG